MDVVITALLSASFMITGPFFLRFHREIGDALLEKWERHPSWRPAIRLPDRLFRMWMVMGPLCAIAMGLLFLGLAISFALD